MLIRDPQFEVSAVRPNQYPGNGLRWNSTSR